jgi:hypothetical protein
MSAGLPTNKLDIDMKAGQLALQLRDVFDQIKTFQAWLAAQTSQALLDKGYLQGDVDIIKSAYTDLDKLRTVYEGTITLPVAQDFRVFAHQLTGIV